VRVVGAGVDLELAQHLAAEGVLGQHAAHRAADELGGLLLEQLGVAGGAQPARVPRVAVRHLRLGLARGEHDLVRVDHDHVVAGVDVRREIGAVLAPQDGRHLGGQATENEPVGVDDVPGPLYLGDLR
jgi:hypothetical protein